MDVEGADLSAPSSMYAIMGFRKQIRYLSSIQADRSLFFERLNNMS